MTTDTKPWEAEFSEGWYEAYKEMVEDRVSGKGPYTLFVFRLEADGKRGRFGYYVGHHRQAHRYQLKLGLAINPFCRVRLERKAGVKGLVVAEVETKPLEK